MERNIREQILWVFDGEINFEKVPSITLETFDNGLQYFLRSFSAARGKTQSVTKQTLPFELGCRGNRKFTTGADIVCYLEMLV
jgi:hypothetical protein